MFPLCDYNPYRSSWFLAVQILNCIIITFTAAHDYEQTINYINQRTWTEWKCYNSQIRSRCNSGPEEACVVLGASCPSPWQPTVRFQGNTSAELTPRCTHYMCLVLVLALPPALRPSCRLFAIGYCRTRTTCSCFCLPISVCAKQNHERRKKERSGGTAEDTFLAYRFFFYLRPRSFSWSPNPLPPLSVLL
jgi:hypothetical protein